MTPIARLRSAEIVNGQVVNANDISAELNQLVNTANTDDSRIAVFETGNPSPSGNWVFSGTVALDNTTTLAASLTLTTGGQFIAALATDPVSPVNGSIWLNTTSNILKAYINGVAIPLYNTTSGPTYPRKYNATAAPVWASTSTFTVANIDCKDSTNAIDIIKATSTTINTATFGLNGIMQSVVQTGTVGTSGSSTTITGSGTSFSSVFQVGDVIYTSSGSARITAIATNTSLTVANALTIPSSTAFKRGGLGASTFYYLYAISDGTTPGLIISTRNLANGTDTLPDLPTGYIYSRQLAFAIVTDTGGNIYNFSIAEGWPQRPKIEYSFLIGDDGASGPSDVVRNGLSSSNIVVSASLWVPPISTIACLKAICATATGVSTNAWVGSGSTDYQALTAQNNASVNSILFDIPITSTQTFYYRCTGTRVSIVVTGYIINGIL